ncbi:TrfB-related DNA-binding protein [Undibacterium sp.]|uniref:TrfB-related DNA-binding protein n=1 Tax=Undibacterium sp. TaxID=1914977 RepID=UPI003753B1E8
MVRTKRRLTQTEFNAVKPFLKISEDRQSAAEMFLVHGKTYEAAAKPFDWTRQAVFDAVKQVWKKHLDLKTAQTIESNEGLLLPPGWVKITLIAPSCLVAKFRDDIANYSKNEINSSTESNTTTKKTK